MKLIPGNKTFRNDHNADLMNAIYFRVFFFREDRQSWQRRNKRKTRCSLINSEVFLQWVNYEASMESPFFFNSQLG